MVALCCDVCYDSDPLHFKFPSAGTSCLSNVTESVFINQDIGVTYKSVYILGGDPAYSALNSGPKGHVLWIQTILVLD